MRRCKAGLTIGGLAAALVIAACGADSGGAGPRTTDSSASTPRVSAKRPCGAARRPPRRYAHVVWIVMENKSYDEIIGSPDAPYENQLAARCGSATNFRAETHPSLPNYLAMTSGSTQGVADDDPPAAHPLAAPSIFSQLGPGWRALQESMPANCALESAGEYAVKHNPAAYFTDIRPACATQDVPLGQSPDLRARFTFVTPNLCNDTHDCSVRAGDRWLRGFFGQIFRSPQYRAGGTAVFLTWDEGSDSNRIATLVAAPAVRPGRRAGQAFNHYSLLRTTEEMLGLGLIGNAARAPSMRRAFGI
jgi:phosphatidylinositol-3-phosphatase